MSTKKYSLWGLAGVVLCSGAVSGAFNYIEEQKGAEQKKITRDAAEVILKRECADLFDADLPDGTTVKGIPRETPKNEILDRLRRNGYNVPQGWSPDTDRDCRFAKNLGASLVAEFSWQSDLSYALTYVASSGEYVNRTDDPNAYSLITGLIERLRKENDDLTVANTIVNGSNATKNIPPFDVKGFLERVEGLDEARDDASDVALWSGLVAAVAAIPLILYWFWLLLLAMIRSARRAWTNPSG